jgi:hypothetical protein
MLPWLSRNTGFSLHAVTPPPDPLLRISSALSTATPLLLLFGIDHALAPFLDLFLFSTAEGDLGGFGEVLKGLSGRILPVATPPMGLLAVLPIGETSDLPLGEAFPALPLMKFLIRCDGVGGGFKPLAEEGLAADGTRIGAAFPDFFEIRGLGDDLGRRGGGEAGPELLRGED